MVKEGLLADLVIVDEYPLFLKALFSWPSTIGLPTTMRAVFGCSSDIFSLTREGLLMKDAVGSIIREYGIKQPVWVEIS